MRYVAGISWPRSGHHLVQRIVRHYFGPEFSYCEFYGGDCCCTFPCSRQGIHFSKNHDFDGTLVPVPGAPYLVQYRDAAASIVSHFELHLRDGNPDTADRFAEFARFQAVQWGRFVRKWVDRDIGAERLVIRYEDLVANPLKEASSILRFFGMTQIDFGKLSAITNGASHELVDKDRYERRGGAGIRKFRLTNEFRYYEPDLFAEIASIAASARCGS